MGTRDCGQESAASTPRAGEAGRTGEWRNKRPVVTSEACLAVKAGKETCQICWSYCPDGCIARGIGPVVDYDYCKGCGICAEVCPSGAITMVPEHEAGSCGL